MTNSGGRSRWDFLFLVCMKSYLVIILGRVLGLSSRAKDFRTEDIDLCNSPWGLPITSPARAKMFIYYQPVNSLGLVQAFQELMAINYREKVLELSPFSTFTLQFPLFEDVLANYFDWYQSKQQGELFYGSGLKGNHFHFLLLVHFQRRALNDLSQPRTNMSKMMVKSYVETRQVSWHFPFNLL